MTIGGFDRAVVLTGSGFIDIDRLKVASWVGRQLPTEGVTFDLAPQGGGVTNRNSVSRSQFNGPRYAIRTLDGAGTSSAATSTRAARCSSQKARRARHPRVSRRGRLRRSANPLRSRRRLPARICWQSLSVEDCVLTIGATRRDWLGTSALIRTARGAQGQHTSLRRTRILGGRPDGKRRRPRRLLRRHVDGTVPHDVVGVAAVVRRRARRHVVRPDGERRARLLPRAALVQRRSGAEMGDDGSEGVVMTAGGSAVKDLDFDDDELTGKILTAMREPVSDPRPRSKAARALARQLGAREAHREQPRGHRRCEEARRVHLARVARRRRDRHRRRVPARRGPRARPRAARPSDPPARPPRRSCRGRRGGAR